MRSLLWPGVGGVALGFREALSYPEGGAALIGFLIASVVWTAVFACAGELWLLAEVAEELTITEVFGRVSVLAVAWRVLVTGALVAAAELAVDLAVGFLTDLALSQVEVLAAHAAGTGGRY